MTSKLVPILTTLAVAAAVSVAPGEAVAERRRNPLDGQPAVRHRVLLVKKRFELVPTFESSLNADYKHTVSGGLKAEYHFSDMLSFGAMGYFGKSFNTGLSNRILGTLEDTYPTGDPTPTRTEFEEHLNQIPVHGAAYVTWTPWYGKLAAFSKAFVAFDFYFSGGLSFAKLDNDCCSWMVDDDPLDDNMIDIDGNRIDPDPGPNNDDPLNDGSQVGLYFGGGIHVFFTDWIALDLSFRNYWFQDNPSGLDFDGDRAVTEDDDRFLNHLFVGIGVSFFFPTKAVRTP